MNNLLILGNGTSRLSKKDKVEKWKGEIWVCNWAYKENLSQITRVGTVHPNVAKAAAQYRDKNGLTYKIWSKPEINCWAIDYTFELKKGWSTGNMMIAQAIVEGHTEITLSGFDMGGPDIYQVNPLPGNQFSKQFNLIKHEWPDVVFHYL